MTGGPMVLAGKRAVITGASQGLGLAIAKAFVRAGSSVLLGARTPADLKQAAARRKAEAPAGGGVTRRLGTGPSKDDVHSRGRAGEL